MSTNAIIAGGGSGIRINGVKSEARVQGSKIEKGDFVQCVNFPKYQEYFSTKDPEYTDVSVNGPTYALISDNILIKFWRDEPFYTACGDYINTSAGLYSAESNGNIYAMWYIVKDGVVDWTSGKAVTFPDVTIEPNLFNENGVAPTTIYNYDIDHKTNSRINYDEAKDPTGKAASNGIYPYVMGLTYGSRPSTKWAFLTGKIITEALSSHETKNGLSGAITLNYQYYVYADLTNHPDTFVYDVVLIFRFEKLDEDLKMYCEPSNPINNEYMVFDNGAYEAILGDQKWLLKGLDNDIVAEGGIGKSQRVTLNNGITYGNSKYPNNLSSNYDHISIENYTYLNFCILKHSSDIGAETILEKRGAVCASSAAEDSRFKHANEGFSFRESTNGRQYCLLYAATGDMDLDEYGRGYGVTIRNNLELHCGENTIYTCDNGVNLSFRYSSTIEGSQNLTHTSPKISSCFVDLCIVSESQSTDRILTAHQNESTIYLNLYSVDHSGSTPSAKLLATKSFNINNPQPSPDQTGGRLILKKIDSTHVLFVKNAIDKTVATDIRIINVGSSSISESASFKCSNEYLQTNYNSIDVEGPIEVTGTSLISSQFYNYSLITITDIYTGKIIKISVTSTGSAVREIIEGVYNIEEKVLLNNYLPSIDGIASQTGRTNDIIRYVRRKTN